MTVAEKRAIFPELERPPIDEVVCGIVFEPVAELDALALGVYWGEREEAFPTKSLLPALTDEAGFRIGPMPMRAFLVNADDQFVVQLQHDRFFMNWRNRGRGYPRFSERHGPDGLLRRALGEWEKFEEFVGRRFKRKLQPHRIDLTKVDVLRRDVDWKSVEELAQIVPVTGVLDQIQQTESREVDLHFVEKGAGGTAVVHVSTVSDGAAPTSLRLEFRLTRALADRGPAAGFEAANEILNHAFFKLIPPDQLARFGLKGAQ